ncbi:MAG TPA: DUF4147 domain-containing protein [Anaerolineae bacterium]|nr:DUF4147 domain-containing protein [Anaerolineae bacterium]
MSPKFSDYPNHVKALVKAALDAADPARAATNHLQRHGRSLTIGGAEVELADGRLFIVSVGKASVPMALAAASILGDLVYQGICIGKAYAGNWDEEIATRIAQPAAFPLYLGNHPVSGSESVQATTAVTDMLAETRENDLVICLISGGTSALLTQPRISLAAWQALNQALLASGCPIDEFNTVRRQLDAVKGGGLARLAAPASVISLILSDVVGNPLPAIGSGPTVLTEESPAEALAVLQRYGIEERVAAAVWQEIVGALAKEQGETAGPPRNLIIGDVRTAAIATAEEARLLGFTTQILTTHLEGEAREAGRFAAAIAQDMRPNQCVILGGETTVTLRGSGIGGRNLETALSAAIVLDGRPRTVLFSLATDGDDGPTGAAGAVVTGETAGYARTHHLNPRAYLDNNDSYTFFRELDTAVGPPTHLIITGPTGTNVNDLICVLTYGR